MRLVFCDDDPEWRKMLVEDATDPDIGWPDWDVFAVEDISEVAGLQPDILVIDMSALTGVFAPDPTRALGPIITFLDLCPGASIVINTAIPQYYVDEIIDDIHNATGNRPYYGGWSFGGWDNERGLRTQIMKAAGLA